MKLVDLLKQAGIEEEVISGLPSTVISATETYIAGADSKLQSATELEQQAAELRRQAELEKTEINNYVENYGTKLTEFAAKDAELDAWRTVGKSLKDKGFDIQIPVMGATPSTAKPAVPGSPAVGGNATVVTEESILGKVGNVMGQWADANNEHIRLFGTPIPDSFETLTQEAGRARKSLVAVISERYKFSDRKAAIQADEQKKHDAKIAADAVAENNKKWAEKTGSNPNLRTGAASRNSVVPKIKSEDFHKSDGNQPTRQRLSRVLENVHKDIAAAQQTA